MNICSVFMKKKNLKFSTNANIEKSKTKCIIFTKKPSDINNIVPVKHLGNTLECDNSMRRDIALKRGKLARLILLVKNSTLLSQMSS